MADVFSKEKRSQVMSLIRAKNTKPELALRKLISTAFYPLGFRYRIHYKKLPGKPDLVFVSQKIAVFVDGAFWHGYTFRKIKNRLPKKYWRDKIMSNIRRDKQTNRALRKLGWRVIRVWDHDISRHSDRVLNKISAVINARKTV